MATASIASATAQYAQLPLPLGVSLPPGDSHALSVSMPTWDDVVGYEEGRPETLNAMACGYPRFFRSKLVVALVTHLKTCVAPFCELPQDDWNLMVTPTETVAKRLQTFLSNQKDAAASDRASVATHSVENGLVWAVVFASGLTQAANRFWQHTGEIVSSRHAQRVLRALQSESPEKPPKMRGTAAHTTVRERVAGLYFGEQEASTQASNVFLYPTGMGSIYAAVRLLSKFNCVGKAILFGFPYLDSLKLLRREQLCSSGVYFLPRAGEAELQQVEEILKNEKVLGIFTEFPCNPLLSVPDLERLASLAHAHGTYLVVDDTVASYNLNPMKFGAADLVVTSLSKIFSGSCTVMGGSLTVSPQCASHSKFVDHLSRTDDSFLLERDAEVLASSSVDVEARVARVNETASLLVQRLQSHPLVKSIYYPQVSEDVARYRRFLRHEPPEGEETSNVYGPVFSVVFHGGDSIARAFYDRLCVAKGPSLGTNFTLVCPYTLLAHFDELDYVETCGVDRNLVRFSIGLEEPDVLWAALHDALRHAESVCA